ncbi:hypothetical protein OBBRIDRAFT_340822 [Obba rivulosa]|uniref:Uncharacterized protein n=1 Tax=Obba rivulosa TaxID=1052685 RepID=A0A8E2DPD5_9APHY|nr:hypothetical protein OBBRIDRAFT_340822 [Obba rivulosa]
MSPSVFIRVPSALLGASISAGALPSRTTQAAAVNLDIALKGSPPPAKAEGFGMHRRCRYRDVRIQSIARFWASGIRRSRLQCSTLPRIALRGRAALLAAYSWMQGGPKPGTFWFKPGRNRQSAANSRGLLMTTAAHGGTDHLCQTATVPHSRRKSTTSCRLLALGPLTIHARTVMSSRDCVPADGMGVRWVASLNSSCRLLQCPLNFPARIYLRSRCL